MKPIVMNKETEEKILKSFLEKFQKEWQSFKENMNDTKFSFTAKITEELKDKITILYTPEAYLKMKSLVAYYDTEVGWYGLVEKLDEKLYRIFDVKICKQYVTGGKVDTDDEDTLEFFNSLTDEEAEYMHFQAHSHVNFGTDASGTDLQNQADVIRNMGKAGFYLFQIWNKKGDINTYLYDLDANMFYDRKDVEIEIENEETTISDWLADTEKLVVEKKYQYYPTKSTFKETGKKNDYSPYLNGYWDGNDLNRNWEW